MKWPAQAPGKGFAESSVRTRSNWGHQNGLPRAKETQLDPVGVVPPPEAAPPPDVAPVKLSRSCLMPMSCWSEFKETSSPIIWFGSMGSSGSCACNCAVSRVMKEFAFSSLGEEVLDELLLDPVDALELVSIALRVE